MKFEVREKNKPERVFGFFWCDSMEEALNYATRFFSKEIFKSGIDVVQVSKEKRKFPSDYSPRRDYYDKGLS